jgi:ribose transport system permease protein
MIFAPGVWIAIVLAILMAIILRRTIFGRYVFALGSNEAAARACGIRTDRLKVWIYSVGGLFFGLAGLVQMSRLRQGDPTVAVGVELDVIASVVIGGGSLNGGEGSILGSMIGALIMAFLRNGCQLMGWPNYIQEIIIGVIIVVAVAIDRVRATRRANSVRESRRDHSSRACRVSIGLIGKLLTEHLTVQTSRESQFASLRFPPDIPP